MEQITKELIEKLFATGVDEVKIGRGIFDLARREEDVPTGRRLRDLCAAKTRSHAGRPDQKEYMELYWDVMLWLAPKDFDSFMLYLERNRKPKDRFYQPRRKRLKPICEALQELARASHRVKMLVMEGKVSNLRSMAADYAELGDKLWERFNAPVRK